MSSTIIPTPRAFKALVNRNQSQECRRAKYHALKALGYTYIERNKFRNWRLSQLLQIVSGYFYSIGRDPQEARDILNHSLAHLEPEIYSLDPGQH